MKMKIFILFGMFLLIRAEMSKKCNTGLITRCLFRDFAKEHESIFPISEVELIKQCQTFVDVRNCLYDYSIQCMTAMDRIVGDFIYSGTGKKMKELCDPSTQLHKDYLKEIDCIKRNNKGVSTCFKDHLNILHYMEVESNEEKLPLFCCGLNSLKKCVIDQYKEKCNQKVVALMELQIEFIYSEWVIEMCKPLYSQLEDCPKKSTISRKIGVNPKHGNSYVSKYLAHFIKD